MRRGIEVKQLWADEDLVELCSRMRAADRKNCAILFADDE